jgi:putative membrane protein
MNAPAMTHEALGDHLALANAVLNGTSALLIVSGRIAIAQGRRRVHRAFMVAAFVTSSIFLLSYLSRVALTGTHVDPHHGILHAAYLAILGSHMLLAMAVVPLVLSTLWLAGKKSFAKHKRVARLTFPIWLYVSVTGVVVYVVLYHVPV